MLYNHFDELPLGISGMKCNARAGCFDIVIFVVIDERVVNVPRFEHRQSHLFWQILQKVQLPFDAQKVHIASDVCLVRDIAKDIVSGYKRVVKALKLRKIDDPHRPRQFSKHASADRSGVKVAVNG